MAYDFAPNAVSNTQADLYGNAFGGATTDSSLKAPGAAPAPPSTTLTTTAAVSATPSAGNGLNPFIVGVIILLGVAILWKLFHEWGRDEGEFADVKVGAHNLGVILLFVFAGVPGVKAFLQAVPWPWRALPLWQSFVAYCLNA